MKQILQSSCSSITSEVFRRKTPGRNCQLRITCKAKPDFEKHRRALEKSWARQHGGSQIELPSHTWWEASKPSVSYTSPTNTLNLPPWMHAPQRVDEMDLWGPLPGPMGGPGALHPGNPLAQAVVYGSSNLWNSLNQVHVLLFGVGQPDRIEGIYSVKGLSNGMPLDTIIAFEDGVDAERYAGLLEATMQQQPTVCPINPQELLTFCMESGYSCRLEAAGSLLIPPNCNVKVTDWERTLRLSEAAARMQEATQQHSWGQPLDWLEHQVTGSFVVDAPYDDMLELVEEDLHEESLAAVKERLERLIREC